jgi:RecA-family ATPase|tara:strand:- start:245 stop:496 length:252 start_codon:yes stop_codon:yes gene_type:complete
MDEFNLPPVPNDVLEALETLPEEKLAKIETQVIAMSMEEATRNPDAFRNKKYTIKTLIKLGRKHTALIRQAVREMSEERGREG